MQKLSSRFALGIVSTATLALLASPAMAATKSLTGGEVCLSMAGSASGSFSFTNDTGQEICDMLVRLKGTNRFIGGLVLDDAAHPGGDWDVDDNRDGSINGTENSAGTAAEGGGGGALTHPDNQPNSGATNARLQEAGADTSNANCISKGGTFSISYKLSGDPASSAEMCFQPTNFRDTNILAFVDGVFGRAETWALAKNNAVFPRFSAFGSDSGILYELHFTVATPGVVIADLESTPKGLVDLAAGIIRFEPPLELSADQGVTIQGTLSDFGTVTVTAVGESAAVDADVRP